MNFKKWWWYFWCHWGCPKEVQGSKLRNLSYKYSSLLLWVKSLSFVKMPTYHQDILWGIFANVNNNFRLFATHFFTYSTTGTTDTHRVPAIYKILRDRKDRKVFEIKAHPMVSKLFEMKLYNSIKFSVTDVPMLVPPLPWNSTQVYLSFLFIFSIIGTIHVTLFFHEFFFTSLWFAC